MKKLMLLFAPVFLFVMTAFVQETNEDLLTSKVWILKNQVMVGIGTHRSLPDETEIYFGSNGTWRSSHLIEGEKEGNWKLSNKKLEMSFGSKAESIKYKLTFISSSALEYKTFLKTAQYTFKWSAK